jgi:predicted RNase H-like nuclease
VKLIGIDGCKAGWLVATSEDNLASLHFQIVGDLGIFLKGLDERNARVVIDVPIGLPIDRPRECDREARRFLKRPRGSSVFPAPFRATLAAQTYREACDLNSRASGKKVSQQMFHILDKIRDVDALVTRDRQRWFREAHPELIFAVLSGNEHGLTHYKKTSDGEQERLVILKRHVPHFDAQEVRLRLGRKATHRDDIIDAVACLITAQRLITGDAVVMPSGPVPLDARGLRMEMVA